MSSQILKTGMKGILAMNVKRLLAAVAIVVLLLCHASLSAEENAKADELWASFQGKPNPRTGDGFEILEKFPLIVQGKGLSATGTALAAIVSYQFGAEDLKNKAVSFFLRAQLVTADELSAKLARDPKAQMDSKKAQAAFWDYMKKALTASGQMIDAAREKAKEHQEEWKTTGVQNACLMDMYLKAAPDSRTETAVNSFAEHRLLLVTAQSFESVDWDILKESIDKHVPMLLDRQQGTCVAVGYLVKDGNKYIFLYRPSLAQYHEGNLMESTPQADKNSEIPWIKNAVKARASIKTYEDGLLKINGPFPSGVEIVPLSTLHDGRMFCFYDWKADMERHYPALLTHIEAVIPNTKGEPNEDR